MIRALFSAASGMVAQQMSIDNIAHNLANSNTTGFKRRRVEFQDLLYQNILAPGTQAGQQTVVPSGLKQIPSEGQHPGGSLETGKLHDPSLLSFDLSDLREADGTVGCDRDVQGFPRKRDIGL